MVAKKSRKTKTKKAAKNKPTKVPMRSVVEELGDPATWPVEDAAYEQDIRRRR